jgi:UDPglucose 6-dehydrogenase
VIVTEWPELRELPTAEVREAMGRPLIVDGRNHLDPAVVVAAGFEYEAIGRPTRATPGGVNGNPQPSRDRETSA